MRQSAGRMSVVAAPLVLLGGLVLAPSITDPCGPTTTVVSTTTVAPTTTVVPVDQNLVFEIEKTGLSPVEIGSVTVADESFLFELGLFGEVDVHVDWGDGSADDVSAAGPFLHTYTTLGRYTITVSGSLTGFGQDPLISSDPLLGASLLKSVRSFGELGITSLNLAFYGSANLIDVPSTLPATVTDVHGIFGGASSFDGDVSGWETGQVTDMGGMFAGASSFNQSLNSWDISAVASMNNMLVGSGLSGTNYDATLNGWGAEDQVRQPNVTLDAGSLQFSRSSRAARTRLRDPSGSNWTIVDGGVQG